MAKKVPPLVRLRGLREAARLINGAQTEPVVAGRTAVDTGAGTFTPAVAAAVRRALARRQLPEIVLTAEERLAQLVVAGDADVACENGAACLGARARLDENTFVARPLRAMVTPAMRLHGQSATVPGPCVLCAVATVCICYTTGDVPLVAQPAGTYGAADCVLRLTPDFEVGIVDVDGLRAQRQADGSIRVFEPHLEPLAVFSSGTCPVASDVIPSLAACRYLGSEFLFRPYLEVLQSIVDEHPSAALRAAAVVKLAQIRAADGAAPGDPAIRAGSFFSYVDTLRAHAHAAVASLLSVERGAQATYVCQQVNPAGRAKPPTPAWSMLLTHYAVLLLVRANEMTAAFAAAAVSCRSRSPTTLLLAVAFALDASRHLPGPGARLAASLAPTGDVYAAATRVAAALATGRHVPAAAASVATSCSNALAATVRTLSVSCSLPEAYAAMVAAATSVSAATLRAAFVPAVSEMALRWRDPASRTAVACPLAGGPHRMHNVIFLPTRGVYACTSCNVVCVDLSDPLDCPRPTSRALCVGARRCRAAPSEELYSADTTVYGLCRKHADACPFPLGRLGDGDRRRLFCCSLDNQRVC